MTLWTMTSRSLRFYWRTHLGVVLAAVVAGAALVGALAVGDSVRASLRALALARLGGVELAMSAPDRFFRPALAGEVGKTLDAPAAAVMSLDGTVTRPDEKARANNVQVLGVDESFWRLGGSRDPLAGAGEDSIVLNERLAAQLGVKAGDSVVLRVPKPSLLPRDAPLTIDKADDSSASRTLTVAAIVGAGDFGNFSLQANQVPPYNAFVPLAWLERFTGQAGANMILLGKSGDEPSGSRGLAHWVKPSAAPPPPTPVRRAQDALRQHFQLADAGLVLSDTVMMTIPSATQPATSSTAPALRPLEMLEVKTPRIFLDQAVGRSLLNGEALGILTYFVNEIRCGQKATPYSMVSGVGPATMARRTETSKYPTGVLALSPELPAMAWPVQVWHDDEIVIDDWLERDLRQSPDKPLKIGDEITLTYYTLGPMRQLLTSTSSFKLARVVPMEGLADDRDLMPPFPGIVNSDSCKDWRPGIPIDQKKIRPEDEAYWKEHRGTPKAFVSLAAAQEMWANRYGDLTAVRYPVTSPADRARIEEMIRKSIDPASIGLADFRPVREQALAASAPATDFGQLFLGFSFFLIVAALLLMGLLFAISLQQRTAEVGTLLAVGWPPRKVRRLLLIEAGVLAAIGAVVGAAGGLAYTKAMLAGLATVWRGAVASSTIQFAASPATVAVGTVSSLAVALATMWLGLRRQARVPARVLLAGGQEIADCGLRIADPRVHGQSSRPGPSEIRNPKSAIRFPWSLRIALLCLIGAIALAVPSLMSHGQPNAGAFFGAGALLLVSTISFCWHVLGGAAGRRTTESAAPRLTTSRLAIRNAARSRWRSLATIGLLACGVFLVVSVGAFRHEGEPDLNEPASPSGGFSLFGTSSLPIYRDLNSPDGRRFYNLPEADMAGVRIVQMRLRQGADASCLNLNKPSNPQLLGVEPDDLRGRFRFVDVARGFATKQAWELLNAPLPEGEVPAVGDANTITWAIGKSVGDALEYTDDHGRSFKVRLVGMIDNSILQGSLIISRKNFEERFPSTAGYRAFLVEAPAGRTEDVSRALTESMWDSGLELVPAARRLAEFAAVENTYLSIFQALGGLGLVLGSVGLGLVVMRNVLERRGELALLRAVGFGRGRLQWLVLAEHWVLLAMGLACGTVSAVLAVLPALLAGSSPVPYGLLALALGGVAVNGVLWTLGATWLATRGNLLAALRNE